MGDDPRTSVVNRYLQCWDVRNVFVAKALNENERHEHAMRYAMMTAPALPEGEPRRAAVGARH